VRSDAHVVRYQLAATLVRPGDTVLDAACGLGYGSHVLASLSPAARIIGIDLSDWAVEFARRNYSSDRVDFCCGSLPEALNSMPNASVDFVVSLETLEHVTDPQALLAAFERVLKPGGRIFVSVPNDWSDETGEDPNPHHLQVYDWARVREELAAHFMIESAWSLTASGCKTRSDRVWRPQPRKLNAVALDATQDTEGEWWLVCASKSPLADSHHPYEETIHSGFEGTTHLVDFAEHYDCPWLLHSMVELPWRIRDKPTLFAVSQKVVSIGRKGSADLGAGLAVSGWRIFEDEGPLNSAASEWLTQVNDYIETVKDIANPHVQRWSVSLKYLRARFFEARGDLVRALSDYSEVITTDIQHVTPTLCTKQCDSALRAGMLSFRQGDHKEALNYWQAGLNAAFQSMRSDPLEFLGSREKPFIFSMNDLVEIADGATRLANAIRTVGTSEQVDRTKLARQLAGLTQRSLRSALGELQVRVGQLSCDLDSKNEMFSAVQGLAQERHARIQALESALEETQQLAIERGHKEDELQAAVDSLKNMVAERDAQYEHFKQSLSSVQGLAQERHARIQVLESALEETQQLAIERAHKGDKLQAAVDSLQNLVAERDTRMRALESALEVSKSEARQWKKLHELVINSKVWRLAAALNLTPKPIIISK